MSIFNCSCGSRIPIVPNLHEMTKAIQNHIIVHKELSGQCITEETLTQEILIAIIKIINKK